MISDLLKEFGFKASGKKIIGGIAVIIIVFSLAIMLLMSVTKIDQGHVGVVYSANGGVEDTLLDDGVKFVWFWKKVTQYPIATETVSYKDLALATKDGKPLAVSIDFNYSNNVDKVVSIFNKFKGAKPEVIENTFLKTRLKDSALSVTSKYTILEIFQNRDKIQLEIKDKFTKDVVTSGFSVSDFTLGTPVPDASTAQAIQAVVDAQQALEALKVEKDKAQEVADRQLIEAKGISDAEIEKARGIAESNRIIQQSITPELLKKMEMEARLKHGWVEIQGATTAVVKE